MQHDKTAMDRLLAYRNLLCAEDHIDEIRSSADADELQKLEAYKRIIEHTRSVIMPPELDKRYHCVVKHLATAYEAMREVYKVSSDELDDAHAIIIRDILMECLERLWGYKPITCERCGNEGETNEHTNQNEQDGDGGTAGGDLRVQSVEHYTGSEPVEEASSDGADSR